MGELNYTLLSEGSSDQALIPVLGWLLSQCGVVMPMKAHWADLTRLRRPPVGLSERISAALDYYPCQLLFVHRDADRTPPEARRREIQRAVQESSEQLAAAPPAIAVVPVRAQEAWFLFNEGCLRSAAGNPLGRVRLNLPRITDLEAVPDPKGLLYSLLREASGLAGRRRRKLRVNVAVHRIAALAEDFSQLRALPAFAVLERDIAEIIAERGWAE